MNANQNYARHSRRIAAGCNTSGNRRALTATFLEKTSIDELAQAFHRNAILFSNSSPHPSKGPCPLLLRTALLNTRPVLRAGGCYIFGSKYA